MSRMHFHANVSAILDDWSKPNLKNLCIAYVEIPTLHYFCNDRNARETRIKTPSRRTQFFLQISFVSLHRHRRVSINRLGSLRRLDRDELYSTLNLSRDVYSRSYVTKLLGRPCLIKRGYGERNSASFREGRSWKFPGGKLTVFQFQAHSSRSFGARVSRVVLAHALFPLFARRPKLWRWKLIFFVSSLTYPCFFFFFILHSLV